MSRHSRHHLDRWTAPARGSARGGIVEVASQRFRERGYADVSMQEIADAAGVTKAALYYHFRGKEALFAEVARSLINGFWSEIIARAEAGTSLRHTLLSVTGVVSESFVVSATLLEDIHRHLPEDVVQDLLTGHPTPETALEDLFRRAMEAGEMRPLDVETVAAIFVGMLMGMAHSQRSHGPRRPNPREAELLVDVLLHGIGPA